MALKKQSTLNNNNARNIAANSLLAFQQRQQRIQESLNDIFSSGELDSRDRRLGHELACGVCRCLITLDHLISKHSNRGIREIDPILLQILRVGLYQLVYLERTPDFAAVHQAVEQARETGIRGGETFVNAVLRSIQRDMEGPLTSDSATRPRATLWRDEQYACQFKSDFLPDPSKRPAKYYSLGFGHPLWLIERWLKQFDQETVRAICLADNSHPALTLRVNRLRCTDAQMLERLTKAGIRAKTNGPAIQLLQPAVPGQLPGYQEGLFFVQDVTAMSATPMLEPLAGQRILDLCAAPGGKTTHLAELMDNNGTIVACDVSSEKLALIEENCRRLGITIVQTCRADELHNLMGRDGPFDAVLVDAPCSNTGVLARRVEVRHLLKPAAIVRLARQQSELLKTAVRAIRPNGKILYSTCSIDTLENESLIQKFLEENSSLGLSGQKLTLPHARTRSCEHAPTSDRNRPTDQAGDHSAEADYRDGGYIALLQQS